MRASVLDPRFFAPVGLMSWLASSLLTLLVGCGPTGPQRIPVSGVVTLDGKPLSDATIIFTPKGSGAASAASIVDGRFSLTEMDGPTVGQHGIRINPHEAELEEAVPSELTRSNRRPRIPRRYQQEGALSVDVNDEKQLLKFELSSKP